MLDEDPEKSQYSTVKILHYATVIAAPDECIPPPSAKDAVKSEEDAIAEFRTILRRYRQEGLIVVMAYVESVD